MLKDMIFVARVIIPAWIKKQLLLKKRRNNSLRSYFNLTRRFYEIGQDKYVERARYKSGR